MKKSVEYIECVISRGVKVPKLQVQPIVLEGRNIIIEGADIYDALCPVSSVTGLRENPLALLQTLVNDPQKSRLVQQLIAELPVVQSTKGVSYDDMIASLQSIFEDGTYYETDKFAERLMSISEDLLRSVGIEKPIKDVQTPASPSVEPSVDPAAPAAE